MTTSEYLKRPDAKGHLKVLDALRRWDPIGVYGIGSTCPNDEYDMYAPEIIALLDSRISACDLAKHLTCIVTQRMGLSSDDKKSLAIATELVAFWKEWKDSQHATGVKCRSNGKSQMNSKTASLISKILAGSIFVSTIYAIVGKTVYFEVKTLFNSYSWHPILLVTCLHLLGVLLCLVGSLAIFLEKRWGYPCVYLTPPIFLLAGYVPSFIPFVTWLPMQFLKMTSLDLNQRILFALGLTLIINLLVIAMLIWTHRVMRRQPTRG